MYAKAYETGFYAVVDLYQKPMLRPPLNHLLFGFILYTCGISKTVYLVSQFIVFGFLAVFSTFMIGKRLFSETVGFYSSILVVSFYAIPSQAQIGNLEFPLAALVAWFILATLWASPFQSAKRCVVLGILFGLGLLFKQNFVVYVTGPFVYLILISCRKTRLRILLLNFFFFSAISLLIAGQWYGRYLSDHFNYIINFAIDMRANSDTGKWTPPWIPDAFSISWFFFYFKALIYRVILIIPFVIFLFGSIFALWHCLKCEPRLYETVIPFFWFFSGYVFLTLLPLKQDRYLLPLLPPVALLGAAPLHFLQTRKFINIMKALLLCTVVMLYLQYYVLPFVTSNHRVPALTPKRETWAIDVIGTDIAKHSRWPYPLLYSLNLQHEFKEITVQIAAAEKGVILQKTSDWAGIEENPMPFLMRADFVLFKSPAPTDSVHWSQKGEKGRLFLLNPPLQFKKHFKLLKSYHLEEDGSTAYLFQRSDDFFSIEGTGNGCPIGGVVEFLGMGVTKENDSFRIEYLWKGIRPMRSNYRIFVHFLDNEANDLGFNHDHEPMDGRLPTSKWPVGKVLKETYYLKPPKELLSTPFKVRIGMFLEHSVNLKPLPVYDNGSCQLHDDVSILVDVL